MPDQTADYASVTNREDAVFNLERHTRNPSGLPIGPATLNLLLVAAIEDIERRRVGVTDPMGTTVDRMAVANVIRRLSPSERFRLHSSLHARIHYVPVWVQEVTG